VKQHRLISCETKRNESFYGTFLSPHAELHCELTRRSRTSRVRVERRAKGCRDAVRICEIASIRADRRSAMPRAVFDPGAKQVIWTLLLDVVVERCVEGGGLCR
jgi:hypothetical protein